MQQAGNPGANVRRATRSSTAVREHWRAVARLFLELLQGARPALDAEGNVLWELWELVQFLTIERRSRR